MTYDEIIKRLERIVAANKHIEVLLYELIEDLKEAKQNRYIVIDDIVDMSKPGVKDAWDRFYKTKGDK